jgi:N4-gp56 family major capsid protein
MAVLSTGTTNFSNTVTPWVQRQVLENLRAKYVHALPGNYQEGEFLKGTNLVTMVAYPDPAASTATLTEGTPPSEEALTISTESFSASQFGRVFAVTDVAMTQSPHNLMDIIVERLADLAAKTIDDQVRRELLNGTNVLYSNGAARSAVSAALTGDLIKRAVARLQAANVPTFPDGYYRAIIHPYAAASLQRDTANGGWMDIYKYTNVPGGILSSLEIGSYAGVRFLISSAASVFTGAGAGSADVYATTIIGPNAYVLAWMQRLQTFLIPPGGDHTDPLAQKAQVGFKMMLGCRLIRTATTERIIRVESTVLTP